MRDCIQQLIMRRAFETDVKVFIDKKWRKKYVRLEKPIGTEALARIWSTRTAKSRRRRTSDPTPAPSISTTRRTSCSTETDGSELLFEIKDYLGLESGFKFGGESHTLAILYGNSEIVLLAFESVDILLGWESWLREVFGYGFKVMGKLLDCPVGSSLRGEIDTNVRVHVHNTRICITADYPPTIAAVWDNNWLSSSGLPDNVFGFVVGESAPIEMQGTYKILTGRRDRVDKLLRIAKKGELNEYFLNGNRKHSIPSTSGGRSNYPAPLNRRFSFPKRRNTSHLSHIRFDSWASQEICSSVPSTPNSVFSPALNSPVCVDGSNHSDSIASSQYRARSSQQFSFSPRNIEDHLGQSSQKFKFGSPLPALFQTGTPDSTPSVPIHEYQNQSEWNQSQRIRSQTKSDSLPPDPESIGEEMSRIRLYSLAPSEIDERKGAAESYFHELRNPTESIPETPNHLLYCDLEWASTPMDDSSQEISESPLERTHEYIPVDAEATTSIRLAKGDSNFTPTLLPLDRPRLIRHSRPARKPSLNLPRPKNWLNCRKSTTDSP